MRNNHIIGKICLGLLIQSCGVTNRREEAGTGVSSPKLAKAGDTKDTSGSTGSSGSSTDANGRYDVETVTPPSQVTGSFLTAYIISEETINNGTVKVGTVVFLDGKKVTSTPELKIDISVTSTPKTKGTVEDPTDPRFEKLIVLQGGGLDYIKANMDDFKVGIDLVGGAYNDHIESTLRYWLDETSKLGK